jgi:hypothetical protein
MQVGHQLVKQILLESSERFIGRCILRLSMVIQKMRQLGMQRIAIRFTSRSAVLSFASSALQPDLRILWNVSIFHRCAYHSSFSIASRQERTDRSVSGFQSIFSRPFGLPFSLA